MVTPNKPSFFRQIGEVRNLAQDLMNKTEQLKIDLERVNAAEYYDIAETVAFGISDLKDLELTLKDAANQEQRVRTGRR